MKTSIHNLGNSKGIIIPSSYLKKFSIEKELDLSLEGDTIILKPIKDSIPRKGWNESIALAMKNEPEEAFLDVLDEEFDNDWQW